jgi:hypothetical protein
MKYLDRFRIDRAVLPPDQKDHMRAQTHFGPSRVSPLTRPGGSAVHPDVAHAQDAATASRAALQSPKAPAKPAKGGSAPILGASAGFAGAHPVHSEDELAREDARLPQRHKNCLTSMVARLGELEILYSVYVGETLEGIWIGFDTETALIEGHKIPALALASASTGDQHRLIHPDRVGEFILAHEGLDYVFHNVAFDFWVVAEHLALRREDEALQAWWAIADDDRMHDTMLLDQLIRLARDDAHPRPRNLAEVAREYAGLVVDKSDPYRLRYAEIIGQDWADVDPGFFQYAIKDPIATWASYQTMASEAIELMEVNGYDPS